MFFRSLCLLIFCTLAADCLFCPVVFSEQTKAVEVESSAKANLKQRAEESREKSTRTNSSKDKKRRRPARRPEPRWYLGRQIAPTMSASGADWLTRKSRDREEQPRKLLDALDIRRSQMVCDFGCGNGFHTIELAKRVGPSGKVFAVDIQQEMLDLLKLRADPRGLKNIVPVLATVEGSNLPKEKLDLVLMVDVYHELFEPQKILAEVHDSLNKHGRLVLVEFREEDPDVPILPLHKMSQSQVLKELVANDFKLVGQSDILPWQHVLFFTRRDSPQKRKPLVPWQSKLPVQSDAGKPQQDPGEPAQKPSGN